jgi:flagellar protein FlgJ
LDLATAERLTSVADPKGLAALKRQSSDPGAAKAVAGQFGALLMQGVMQGTDGTAMPVAGGGVGGNVISGLFADTISQAVMSGDKLGLADILFRSIEAKQRAATGGGQENQAAIAPSPAQGPTAPPSAEGFPLSPYWQGNGLRPLASSVARTRPGPDGGKAGWVVSSGDFSPTQGWAPSLSKTAMTGASDASNSNPRASGAASSTAIQSFTQQLGPLLQEAGRQLGVSPRLLLAQAALETGWGRSVVGNNVFGIKASPSWSGAEVTTMTHEVEAGQMVPREASFRAYPSLDAAVQDYVALIGGSSRYQAVVGVGDDASAYAKALVAGGYATDNQYARKLEAIAGSPSVAAAFDTPSQPARRPFATQG